MKKKERRLTPAELERKKIFEAKVYELSQQGYHKKDLTMGIIMINIMAIVVMIPIIVLFCWLYITINQQSISLKFDSIEAIIFIVSIFALTILHEGIHGLTWALFSKKHFRAIKFGFIWKMLTPYCTCKEQLTKGQYVLGAIMPTIIVGILPAIIAITNNYVILFSISLIMIIGGGGDVLIILKLLFHNENGKESIYMDHPYECGAVVFEKTIVKE